jgi:hypothetical protein
MRFGWFFLDLEILWVLQVTYRVFRARLAGQVFPTVHVLDVSTYVPGVRSGVAYLGSSNYYVHAS